MSQKIKILLSIAGFVLLIVLAVIAYNALLEQVSPDIELASGQGDIADADKQEAPDFMMEDWDGNSIKLSDLIAGGKPVVLNFWASWCPPCKDEMPEFERVFQVFGEEVQFVMLNLIDGLRETKETGAKYIMDQGFTFPVFFDTKRDGASAYGIRSIPTTLFIDKDGYIVAEAQGAIDEATLRKGIDLIK